MPEGWSRVQVEAVVADYLEMLALELRGEDFNKLARNRALQAQLARSHAAIEKKHQNISAILTELGWRYIDGYKPLGNYQDLLHDVVAERLAADSTLSQLMAAAADATTTTPSVQDILACMERPPKGREPRRDRASEEPRRRREPRLGVNYLAREANNASLGAAGERFAVAFERARLIRAGRESLADRIEHVSATVGDGAGFDIRSFELNGRDRLIEVKTTAGGKETPFFVSRNEVEVSRELHAAYRLYRLFRFRRQPRLFTLAGALEHACRLDPLTYSAMVA
jgi:hypothetical protein